MLLRCKKDFNGLVINKYYDIKINEVTKYAIVSFQKGDIIDLMTITREDGFYYLYDYFYKPLEDRLIKLNKIKERINATNV